jgi:PAS domain S-box-containing protein
MVENRTVLIVDHEPRAALDMGRVLRSAGCEVFEAANGKECMSVAREKRPQLILVDEALPDISGIDLVKEMKRDAQLSRAYIAMLSRDGTAPAIRARALENGADALILRTAQTRELLARVDALLRRQAAEETLRKSLQDYRATFDAMSDAVYLVNTEYTITDCNLAMARFLARPRGDIIGGRCFELVHGTAKPLPGCLGHRVRDTRRRETLVVPMDERWLQVDVDPLLDASGAVIGSVHVLRDITEQRRTEDELQQAQAELDSRATEHHLALDKAHKDLQAEIDVRVHTQDVLKQAQTDLERRSQELEEAIQARCSAEDTLQQAQQELTAAAAQRRAQ